MSYYREQLNEWLSKIDVEAERVIDVGGGDSPVKDKVREWEVNEYHIMDNDAQFKPDVFHDFNKSVCVNEYCDLVTKKADVIFCLELMEYIYDPVQAHENLNALLKLDVGIAYITYPTIYPLHNPPGIDYLRYSKNAIEKLLTVSGFKTWEITPRIATMGRDNLANFYVVEGMRAMKHTEDIYHIGYMVKAYV